MKCQRCKVQKIISEIHAPACCAWYLDNVACGTKSVDDCKWYEPISDVDTQPPGA